MDVAGRARLRPGLRVKIPGVVAHQDVDAVVEHRPGALERTPRHHVDAAGERRTLRLGRGGIRYLDAREVVDRDHVGLDVAGGGTAGGGGDIEAVDCDRHVGRGYAVDRDVARVATGVIDGDAGHEFQELRHVALGHAAKLVRRDYVFDIGGKALLIYRERGGVHLARGLDPKRVEFNDRAVGFGSGCGHGDVMLGSLSGGDESQRGQGRQAGVEGRHTRRAGRYV